MRCPSCGSELRDGKRRCDICGYEVEVQGVSELRHRRGGIIVLAIAALCLVAVGVLALHPNATNTHGSTVAHEGTEPSGQPLPTDGSEDSRLSNTEVPKEGSSNEGHREDAKAGLTGELPSVPVRDTVDEYTWEELGAIAQSIASAPTDEEGLQIAITYHLCDSNGKLDGSQTKRFSMADGIEAQAQIIGFRHDQKSDGSGLAGISFMTKDCVAMHHMNERDDNTGGWRDSAMRAWLSQEVFPALPEDLRSQIVAVDKLTNNVGRTDYTSCISKTSDLVWLVSMEEIVGVIEKDDWMRSALGNGWYSDEVTASDAYERLERLAWTILNLEGTQYQLFPDLGLDIYGHNPFLIKTYQGEIVQWWERNPSPGFTNNFHICHRDGSPDNTERPQTVAGVAISFSL